MMVHGRDPATGDGVLVTIEGERIATVDASPGVEGDPWLASGLVDLQINGFAGIDLNDGCCDAARVVALCRAVARTGTTTFLPTLITAAQQSVVKAAHAVREACEREPEAAQLIAGIHLEGPAISPREGYRGAHPAAWVRAPLLDELMEVQEASGGRVRLVTLSPHWDEAGAFIRALTARSIVCAIGHTHATARQIAAAVEAGARMSTHLGNGLPLSLARHENPIWPQLAEDHLTASVIADGVHLPPEVLRVVLRAKGVGRCVLISDAVAMAGMPRGAYGTAIGGEVVVGVDRSVRMKNTGLLAGSGVSLAMAVARCVRLTPVTLAEALAMASEVPARLMGLDRGLVRVGAYADLILFSYKPGETVLSLEQVVVRGRIVEHDCILETA